MWNSTGRYIPFSTAHYGLSCLWNNTHKAIDLCSLSLEMTQWLSETLRGIFTIAYPLVCYLMIYYIFLRWIVNTSVGHISIKDASSSKSAIFATGVSFQLFLIFLRKCMFGKFCNVHDHFLNVLQVFAL